MDKFEYCETIIKTNSQGFYKAFSLLPKIKAESVFAIYTFCRLADDAVDIDHDIDQIHQLKKKIKCTFEEQPPQEKLFEALFETFKRFPSEIDPYLDLLEGMRDDYYNKPIETNQDFDDYCYKAASTVGLMLLPVIASKRHKTDKKQLRIAAIELGKAMQFTNILRDVREDFMKDRVYFPNEALEKYGISIETFKTGLVTPSWRSLMLHYIKMAKEKYRVFYEHVELFDSDAIFPVYLAARFYEGILDEIEKKGFTNLTKRHVTSVFKKWRMAKEVKKILKRRGLLS